MAVLEEFGGGEKQISGSSSPLTEEVGGLSIRLENGIIMLSIILAVGDRRCRSFDECL